MFFVLRLQYKWLPHPASEETLMFFATYLAFPTNYSPSKRHLSPFGTLHLKHGLLEPTTDVTSPTLITQLFGPLYYWPSLLPFGVVNSCTCTGQGMGPRCILSSPRQTHSVCKRSSECPFWQIVPLCSHCLGLLPGDQGLHGIHSLLQLPSHPRATTT